MSPADCYRLGYERLRSRLSTAEKALAEARDGAFEKIASVELPRLAEPFAKYHEEHARYGGASGEFHERAASFLRSIGLPLSAGDAALAANKASDSTALEKALGALRAVEWKGEAGFWEEAGCPECREGQRHGHQPWCQLAAALSGGAHVDALKAQKVTCDFQPEPHYLVKRPTPCANPQPAHVDGPKAQKEEEK